MSNLWDVYYINVADMILTTDLTFTTFRALASGISPTQLVNSDVAAILGPEDSKYAYVLNMRASGTSSNLFKYNLPKGTIIKGGLVKIQEFKIIDYRLPDSGFLPIKTNQSLNFFPSVIADATSQNVILSLPSSSGSGWIGQSFSVKKIDSTINTVYLSGISGDKIDGQSTYEITHPFESIKVQSNGSGWYIVG